MKRIILVLLVVCFSFGFSWKVFAQKFTGSFQMSSSYGLFSDSDIQKAFNESFFNYRGALGFENDSFRVEGGYTVFRGKGGVTEIIISGLDVSGSFISDKRYRGIGFFSGTAEFSAEYRNDDFEKVKIKGEGDAFGIKIFLGYSFARNFFVESFYYILKVSPKGSDYSDENSLDFSHLSFAFGARF